MTVPYWQTVVHGFKHSLSVLKGNLQLIEQRELFDMKTMCLYQIEKMDRLIDQALINPHQAPKGRALVNLNEVVFDVTEFLSSFCCGKSIRLRKDLVPIPNIWGDRDALFHAVFNGIANALDAIGREGAITLQTKMVETKHGEWVALLLHDTGMGIPAEQADDVFLPYVTTKSNRFGHGLGLSILRQVVLEHEGEVTLESDVGKGTVLSLCFPPVGEDLLAEFRALAEKI